MNDELVGYIHFTNREWYMMRTNLALSFIIHASKKIIEFDKVGYKDWG